MCPPSSHAHVYVTPPSTLQPTLYPPRRIPPIYFKRSPWYTTQVVLSVAMDYVFRKVLLRYFLVPLCSIFIMMSTYALDPVENLNARYTVSSGLLISTILFHVQSVMKVSAG